MNVTYLILFPTLTEDVWYSFQSISEEPQLMGSTCNAARTAITYTPKLINLKMDDVVYLAGFHHLSSQNDLGLTRLVASWH